MQINTILEAVLNSAFFNLMVTIGIAVGGWLAKEMWGLVRELRLELTELQRMLPIEYVRKDDFKALRADFSEILERIEAKLDSKVDRGDCSRFHQSTVDLDDKLRRLLEKSL